MKQSPILHANIHGNGPTIVLLHGFLSSSHYWRRMVELLESQYRVITIDLLGFGKSPKPRRTRYDYQAQLDAINATLKKYEVTTPFTMIGHSMGALIALRYSVVYNGRVKQLLMVNMPIFLGKKELRREIFRNNKLHRFGLEFGVHHLTWAAIRLSYRLKLLPKKIIQAINHNETFFQNTASSRIGSFYNVIGSAQVAEDLARLSVPSQMLSGTEDKQIYLKNLHEKITLSPSVELVTYPTGHHIPWDMPERIMEKLQINQSITVRG